MRWDDKRYSQELGGGDSGTVVFKEACGKAGGSLHWHCDP